jgi:hypothetical protein
VRLPAEEAAAVSGASVRPTAAALDARVQPPGAAEEVSALSGQPRVAEEEASGAAVARPPEAAGVALDAVAEPQRAEAAEELPDVAVQRPEAAAEVRQDEQARQPAAERPSAAPPCGHREGHPLPWLVRRQSVRSAHATLLSRTASPSKQSWRAAGCGGLS